MWACLITMRVCFILVYLCLTLVWACHHGRTGPSLSQTIDMSSIYDDIPAQTQPSSSEPAPGSPRTSAPYGMHTRAHDGTPGDVPADLHSLPPHSDIHGATRAALGTLGTSSPDMPLQATQNLVTDPIGDDSSSSSVIANNPSHGALNGHVAVQWLSMCCMHHLPLTYSVVCATHVCCGGINSDCMSLCDGAQVARQYCYRALCHPTRVNRCEVYSSHEIRSYVVHGVCVAVSEPPAPAVQPPPQKERKQSVMAAILAARKRLSQAQQ